MFFSNSNILQKRFPLKLDAVRRVFPLLRIEALNFESLMNSPMNLTACRDCATKIRFTYSAGYGTLQKEALIFLMVGPRENGGEIRAGTDQ